MSGTEEHPGADADLLAACAAFDAVHAETTAPRGETAADDEALEPIIDRWYAALDAIVAIPARTAPGQQAKLRTAYIALEDALHDAPLCGRREEWAAIRVLAEAIGIDPAVPPQEPEPVTAPVDAAQPSRLSDDLLVQDDAIFDIEGVLADMRADVEIIKHVARTEAPVSLDVWIRIHDHLDLALDTLDTSWKLIFERRNVLHDALKAERAACKALERARGVRGSAADIERAEAMWSTLRAVGKLALQYCDEAAPAA